MPRIVRRLFGQRLELIGCHSVLVGNRPDHALEDQDRGKQWNGATVKIH